jgi:hypothetical protein
MDDAKRRRRRQRMRRLFVLVAVVDLIGGGALAYALTRPTNLRPAHPRADAVVAHPINPLTLTVSTSSSATDVASSTTGSGAVRRQHRPHRRAVVKPKPSTGCRFDVSAARGAVASERAAGYRVGFAVMTAAHRTVVALNANTQNYGASVTKALLLVAYLHQYAAQGLDSAAAAELTQMIEVSDNTAADWVYAHLPSPTSDVEAVAAEAGMTGFRLDLSDPVYTLGQSLVTAHDLAGLFADIGQIMPARYERFGMNLLVHVQERVGLLAAGLPGVVYSKEGWKPENPGLLGAPYVVNQAAQFTCRGVTYGVAVTVGHAADQTAAEGVVQRITSSLMDY